MDCPMDRLSTCLPRRFPVGATYIIEGYGGETGRLRVTSRYVLLPDGRRIDLAADFGMRAPPRRFRRGNLRQGQVKSGPAMRRKKILAQGGTGSRARR